MMVEITVAASGKKFGKAIYKCITDVEDELSFMKGDIIEILPTDGSLHE